MAPKASLVWNSSCPQSRRWPTWGARDTFLPCEMKWGRTRTDSTSLGHEPTSRRLVNASFGQCGVPALLLLGNLSRHDLCRPQLLIHIAWKGLLMPMVPPGSESTLMMDTQLQGNRPSNQTRHSRPLAELTITQLACFKTESDLVATRGYCTFGFS